MGSRVLSGIDKPPTISPIASPPLVTLTALLAYLRYELAQYCLGDEAARFTR